MRPQQIRGRQKGFTLIELLVVASIISLLASIILVTVDTARQRARVAAVKQNMQTLYVEAELYRSTHNGYRATPLTTACGSVAGFLTTERAAEAIAQISRLSKMSTGSNNFYCSLLPDKWSIAVSLASLTNTTNVLCASSMGRIVTFGNSNDSPASDFVSAGECSQP